MITPHHLIYNTTLGKRFFPHWPFTAILAGALFPDIWVWLFFAWYGLIWQVPEPLLWGDYYFKSAWNGVFCLAHSLWLLPLCVLAAKWRRNTGWLAFFSSALLHALCDFFVHHSDAYRNFFPFSDWRFESPLSYWEPAHYGLGFSILDGMAIMVCLAYWHFQPLSRRVKWLVRTLMVLEVAMLALAINRYPTMHH